MKNLEIVVVTTLSPAKVDLSLLEAEIENLIEYQFEAVCKSVRFHEISDEDEEET